MAGRNAILILALIGCLSAAGVRAGSSTDSMQDVVDRLGAQDAAVENTRYTEYTERELEEYGFTTADLASYHARLQSKAGRWWGHLSPMELMMYSAESDLERRRFARMYLESMHPKSLAERDAVVTLYAVARDMYKEKVTNVLPVKRSLRRPILFVDLNCDDCKADVIELVQAADAVLDIYVTGLDRSKDRNAQLIHWARSMQLPPSRITLNADRGIYQQRYGQPLDRLHLVSQ